MVEKVSKISKIDTSHRFNRKVHLKGKLKSRFRRLLDKKISELKR